MWTTLGEIGKWQAGGTPNRTIKSYYGGEIPWLKTGDLNDGIIENIPESITEEALQNSSAKLNPTNSILIAMYGATIGKLGILSYPAATNQACCACIEYSAVEKYYLFYFLLSHRHHFIYKGGGGAQPNISKEKILNTAIPLPPIEEQRRIIKAIEKWFLIINIVEANKNEALECIKVAKNKILDLAIHGKLVPQHPADEPAIKLLKRVNPSAEITCDNEHYPKLPENWVLCKLSNLCKILNGFAFSSNDYKLQGIPLIRISNIIHNTIDKTDCVYIDGETDEKFKILKGDLLIAMSGATTGKMGVYPYDETAYLNQRVGNIKIISKSVLNPDYRNFFMQSKVDEILKFAYGGAQPNISASVIGDFLFPLPPYKEQVRIVETVQRIFSQCDIITDSL